MSSEKEINLKEFLLKLFDDNYFFKKKIINVVVKHTNNEVGSLIFLKPKLPRSFFEEMSDNRYLYMMRKCKVENYRIIGSDSNNKSVLGFNCLYVNVSGVLCADDNIID